MKTPQTIHAQESPLRKVFGDDYRFRIPSYQRPYAWEREHVTALLDDLETARTELPDYFLGSIVLVSSPDGYQDVIDGQQRLTSLTLLISLISHLLPPEQADNLAPFLRQQGNPVMGLPTTYRLTVREQEQEFFEKHVQEPGGLESLLNTEPEKLREVERRIQDNAKALLERLQHVDAASLVDLATYIAQHAFLVVVRADQFETAYRIFTVMNDRGLELAASDILKATVVGKLDPSMREKYADIWEDSEEMLGRDAFSELFSHIRMIKLRKKATYSILKELQESVLPEYDPHRFIDDLVVPYGDLLYQVHAEAWKGGNAAGAINRLLRWLAEIDNFDWVPPTLRWMQKHQNDSDAVLSFLHRLDRLASSMHLRRVYVQPRIKRYGRVLDALEAGVDLLDRGGPLDLTGDERAHTLQVLEGQLYGLSGGVSRYVLMRLDACLTDSAAVWEHEVVSVEHVLPQSPPPDSEWSEWFTAEEREFWTHRLANLVPLNRRRNSAAQNYGFEKKKRQYFAVDGQASPFTLTNQVLHCDDWTPARLSARQETLVAKLVQLWGLDQDDEA